MKEEHIDLILTAIAKTIPYKFEDVRDVYEICGSYDAIIEIDSIARKFNKDFKELALYFYGI